MLTHAASIESAAHMPDLSWSCLPPPQERHLQDHVHVPPADGVRYGTREIGLTVRVGETTFFVYREFAADEDRGGEPHAPTLVAAQAHPGGDAGVTIHVAGEPWLVVRA